MKKFFTLIAPILAGWAAVAFGNWRIFMAIFLAVAIVAFFALSATPIQENVSKDVEKSTFKGCFALLADKVVLLSFLGIICHVGIDVGINVTAPKLLMERLDMTLEGAGLATAGRRGQSRRGRRRRRGRRCRVRGDRRRPGGHRPPSAGSRCRRRSGRRG